MTKSLTKRSPIMVVLEKIIDVIVLIMIVAPILLIIWTAFKPNIDSFTLGAPNGLTLENYTDIMSVQYNAGGAFLNSLIIASFTTVIVVPIAVMSSFAFSRIKFKASNLVLTYVLACQFLPPVVYAIPYFSVMRTMGLVDTHLGLIIINLATCVPYCIWILLGYVDALPADIEEAAYVDGCNRMQAMVRVTVPLVMPGILTSTVMTFIMSWNEFLFASVMTSVRARTLPIALMTSYTNEGLKWGWMCAFATLIIIPVFCLAMPIRKHFVNGITMGSDK